jgi:hypothetical protein
LAEAISRGIQFGIGVKQENPVVERGSNTLPPLSFYVVFNSGRATRGDKQHRQNQSWNSHGRIT